MDKSILGITLFILVAVSACSQQNWGQWTTENHLSGGTILSIRYNAPPDSGEVHLAFVMPDTTYCYGGYRVKDRFPPRKDFDITVKWKKCGMDLGSVTDSARVVFRGREKVIEHKDASERAAYGDVFLIVYQDAMQTHFRRVEGLHDLKGLPAASKADIQNFLRDDLGWVF